MWAGLWPPEPPQSEHMFYRVSIIAKKGAMHNPSKAANFKAKIAASGNYLGSARQKIALVSHQRALVRRPASTKASK
jgi:hypothetical protein